MLTASSYATEPSPCWLVDRLRLLLAVRFQTSGPAGRSMIVLRTLSRALRFSLRVRLHVASKRWSSHGPYGWKPGLQARIKCCKIGNGQSRAGVCHVGVSSDDDYPFTRQNKKDN